MSGEFPKKKGKRPRPAEDNSFVKNVTATMSSFLPASITKWFSPNKSDTNGSAPAADATDSSTEDESPDRPVVIPAKRMRFSPPEFNNFKPADITCVNTSIDNAEPKYTPTQSLETPNSKMFFHSNVGIGSIPKRKSIFQTSLFNDPPITGSRKTTEHSKSEPKHTTCKPTLLSSPFYPGKTMYGGASSSHINRANIKERKMTLVQESKANDNSTMSHAARRVMELLENTCTPLLEAKRISSYVTNASSDNITSGVLSTKVTPYKLPELHVPSIASLMQLKHRSRLMDTTSAARQIIASHSSTLPYQPYPAGARKEQPGDDNKDKYVTKIKSRLNGPRQVTKKLEHTYNTPLNLPTGILEIGTDDTPKFNFTKVSATTAPTMNNPSSNVSNSSSTIINIPSTNGNKFMKTHENNEPNLHELNNTKLSKPLAVTNFTTVMKPDVVEIGSLKPVSSEPKMIVCQSHESRPINTITLKKPEKELLKCNVNDSVLTPALSDNMISNDPYKFSSPVILSIETPLKTSPPATFTFGSPERKIDNKKIKEKISKPLIISDEPVIKTNKNNPDIVSKDWRCSDCWATNKGDVNNCLCCGAVKLPKDSEKKPVKCLVCDSDTVNNKCQKCEKKKILKDSTSSSKWKCQDCWVSNDTNVDTCVCCGGSNPNKLKEIKAPSYAFKSPGLSGDSEWKCNDCWIKNKGNVKSCAACGGSKPGANITNQATFSTIGNNFNNANTTFKNIMTQTDKWECGCCLVKNENNISKCVCCGFENPAIVKEPKKLNDSISQQSDKWECPSCLVKNENNRSKCICCEFEKPGTAKDSTITSFNFGMNTNTTFKFGIDTSTGKDAEVPKKVDVPETNNNVLPKTPSFTFGIPLKKNEDLTNATKETRKLESPKLNFTFGMPQNQSAAQPLPPSVFGSPSKLNDSVSKKIIEEEEKLQEVPKIEISSTTSDHTSKPLSGIFGSSVIPQPNISQGISMKEPISQLTPSVSVERKDPLTLQTHVSNTQSTQDQNMFTFKSPGIKPAVNLFSTPVTTMAFQANLQTPSVPSTSNVFFNKPESTNTLFQKPDITSTVSLFSKPENTAPSTVSSLAPSAPIFSFGTNGSQLSNPQSDKPKFNFAFGGGNTTFNSAGNSAFVNTFSTPSDTNANKFDISGNGLGINSGGLGVNAGNTLLGNGLASNKLGSNELSTNRVISVGEPQPGSGLFSTVQKDNLWMSTTTNAPNAFVPTTSASLQKPAAFSFGSPMPFNNNTPAFGGNQAPGQNMFGINQNANNQSSMFSNQVVSQTPPCIFGNPQPAANPTPAMNMFGSPNACVAPAFGAARPAFETPSMTAAPQPFNFGVSQPAGVFGMMQQQQQQQSQPQPAPQSQTNQPAGMYNFGAPSGGAPQFNIGSAPNTSVRRVRKAVRRNTPR